MSTILRALKKAGKESGMRLEAALIQTPRASHRRGLIAGVIVLGIAIGLWVGYLTLAIPPVIESKREVRRGEPVSAKALPALVEEESFPLRLHSGTISGGAQPEPQREGLAHEVPDAKPEPLKIGLSGVIYDPVHPMAIINGSLVGVGDSVSGARILRIERDRVRIGFKGKEQTIRINQ